METQLRVAIRDSVNQDSRKPFYWGGLKGYQQLEGVAEGLHQVAGTSGENEFLQRLIRQVDRTLAQNQTLAAELEETHGWLCKVATCLRYPPTSYSEVEWQKLNSQPVAHDMEDLLKQLRQATENKSILSRFCNALSKRLERLWPRVLHCYDISGLPRIIYNSKAFSIISVVTSAGSVDVIHQRTPQLWPIPGLVHG